MTGLATIFALIIEGLCRAVAARAARNRAATPILVLLWKRLRRMVKRFDSLVARIQAGQIPSLRPPRGPRAPTPRPPDPLPRGAAWVIHAVPESTVYASQLRYLLANPDMAALLAADPRAGRILRPLCHMLGIEPGPNTVPPTPPTVRPPPDTPSADILSPDPCTAMPGSPGEPLGMVSSNAGSPFLGTLIMLRYNN